MNASRDLPQNRESGRVVEGLLELLALVTIVPPLVCCALSAALALVGIVVPWLGLVMITAIVCACLSAGIIGRGQRPPGGLGPLPPPRLPAIRRPPGIHDQRRDRLD